MLTLCRNSATYNYDTILAVTHDRGAKIPDLYRTATASGITSQLIECRHKYDLGAIKQVRHLIDAQEIDVVHCHGYREDFYAVLSRARVRKVTTNHLWKRTTRALRFYARVDSFLIRRFDRVVAVSMEIFRELAATGFVPPQLTCIPNGIDVSRYAPEARRAADPERHTPRHPDRSPVTLIAVGSLTKEKGHDYLLEAVASLGNDFWSRLLIAGDGPRRDRLIKLATDLKIADRVEFLGQRSDIPEILKRADIFVLPSLAEGLPIALLEAMACERACVASAVGDVASAIETDVTGVLVRASDTNGLAASIKRLARDPALRTRLGQAARRRVVERFSAERMTEAYCRLYDGLLAEA